MNARPDRQPMDRPALNTVQLRTMITAVAILLAGTVGFIVIGRGFVVALAGLCATVTVVVGAGIDFLRH